MLHIKLYYILVYIKSCILLSHIVLICIVLTRILFYVHTSHYITPLNLIAYQSGACSLDLWQLPWFLLNNSLCCLLWICKKSCCPAVPIFPKPETPSGDAQELSYVVLAESTCTNFRNFLSLWGLWSLSQLQVWHEGVATLIANWSMINAFKYISFPSHQWGMVSPGYCTNPYFMSKQKQDCSVALMTILSWVVEAPNERYAPQIGSSPQGSGWKFMKSLSLVAVDAPWFLMALYESRTLGDGFHDRNCTQLAEHISVMNVVMPAFVNFVMLMDETLFAVVWMVLGWTINLNWWSWNYLPSIHHPLSAKANDHRIRKKKTVQKQFEHYQIIKETETTHISKAELPVLLHSLYCRLSKPSFNVSSHWIAFHALE